MPSLSAGTGLVCTFDAVADVRDDGFRVPLEIEDNAMLDADRQSHSTAAMAVSPSRRSRRYDPQRKEHILAAAMAVITEHGIAGTSHRAVAAAADVPLGSLTYHFAGLDDLVATALERMVGRMARTMRERLADVGTTADLVSAITDLLHGPGPLDVREWVALSDLRAVALRRPVLRPIAASWSRDVHEALARVVDPDTARILEVLVAGLALQLDSAGAGDSAARTRETVGRLIALDDG